MQETAAKGRVFRQSVISIIFLLLSGWLAVAIAGCGSAAKPNQPGPGQGPSISNVTTANPTSSSIAITWTTDVPASSTVEYGPSPNYGSSSNLDSNLVTSHSQALTGLSAGVPYHYRVRSRDANNREAISGDFSFTLSSTPTASDFSSRCADSNVIRCFGFDSQATAAPFIQTFNNNASVDNSLFASGGGSLRFDIPALSDSSTSGYFALNFADDYSIQFGEGGEFYVQWRQRFSPEFLSDFSADGGGGWKQSIISAGDRPGFTAGSCTDIHIVTHNNYYLGFPQMYHSCGPYQPFQPVVGNDYLYENSVDCLRSQPTRPPCFGYVPNEWMTFQIHVKVGHWYKADGNFHRDSTVELWVARENQPSKLVISMTGYDLFTDPSDPLLKYGKVWLLPYDTGRQGKIPMQEAFTWYDELVISRRRVPDPNVNTPNPPDALTTTGASATQVNLAWRSNSSNQDGFYVERCPDAPYECNYRQAFTQIAQVPASATTYSDVSAQSGVAYSYRVRAFNSTGTSAYSNNATNLPAAPSDLVATALSNSQAKLTWTVNSNDETAFSIVRCAGASCSNFVEIAQVGARVNTFTDSGLSPATTYSYSVRSLNAAGSWKDWGSDAVASSNHATVTTNP